MQLYTIAGKKDGFGSQYQAVMSGIALCEKKGYTYVHTPFKEIEHGANVDEMNTFIGLKNDKVYDESQLKNMITEEYSSEVHRSEKPSEYYTETVLKKIRDAYYSTEKPKISDIDIAIHIRRGDVKSDDPDGRFISNTAYLKIINSLKKKYPRYKILIFSQGAPDDFKELGLEETSFRLNEPIPTTFHSLVSAKVLVMSKSSLSYAAALLNRNKVYYQPFWHKSLDNWTNIDSLQLGGGRRSKKNKRTHSLKNNKRRKSIRKYYYGGNMDTPLISGFEFRNLCKFNLDNRYPLVPYDSTMVEGDRVFSKISDIPTFLQNPPSKKVTLVIHNSDETFNDTLMESLRPYVNNVYATNCSAKDAVQIPLGFRDDKSTPHKVLSDIRNDRSKTGNKSILCLVNFLIGTNGDERTKARDAFKGKEWATLSETYMNHNVKKSLDFSNTETQRLRAEYYAQLKQTKFVICPPGTGVDTHRVYESLYFGAIPIIKTSFLDPLYAKLGNCWIVNDWSEVTEEKCKRRWASRKDVPFKMSINDWSV
jgi:hypothetical protein